MVVDMLDSLLSLPPYSLSLQNEDIHLASPLSYNMYV